MLRICAVLAVRNESPYLERLLPALAAQEIDVVVVDHQSTDESRAVCERHRGAPVLSVVELPYTGEYSQTRQLEVKREVIAALPHDWVIHHDADEFLEHAEEGRTLRQAIEEADAGGYTALNFDEFVFLPEPGSDHRGRDYRGEVLRYYHFAPHANRLNRAWRRGIGTENLTSGGHVLLGGSVRIDPRNHVLRHYIVLSQEHALAKYVDRRFNETDLLRGWHGNRLGLSAAQLALPVAAPWLFRLERGDAKDLRRDRPVANHYWHWDVPQQGAR